MTDSSSSSAPQIPGFEGSEKKLVVDFCCSRGPANLRLMPRAEIDAFLSAAKCTIISQTSSDAFDSYVLSESSLFVYPGQVIVKTCGTTSLLYCLPLLLASAAKLHCRPEFVSFSRANYLFAHVQPAVHRDFDSEVEYLGRFFQDGQAYILGPINGPRWHLYVADVARTEASAAALAAATSGAEPVPVPVAASRAGREQTFEVVMTSPERSAMAPFYRRADDPDALVYHAKHVTALVGIDQLLPGAIVDDFLFEPCGYSCNGVRGAEYFTIHITPEPHCAFVSFETNAQLSSYDALLERVLAIFRPAQFSVSIFVDNASALGSSQQALVWDYAGFSREDCCYHEFGSSSSNIAYANFAHESRPRVTCEVAAAAVAAVAAKPAVAVSELEVDEKCPEDEEQQQLHQKQQLAHVQALLARLGVGAKQTTTVVLPSAAAAAILTKREQPQPAVVVADAAAAVLSM